MIALCIMQIVLSVILVAVNIWILIKLYKIQKSVKWMELFSMKGCEEPTPVLRRLVTREDEGRVEKFIDDYLKNRPYKNPKDAQ